MFAGRIRPWLLALSNPCGPPADVPWRRLRRRDLARLGALADKHKVLPAVVANLEELLARLGPGRVLAGGGARRALPDALAEARKRLCRSAALSLLLRGQLREIAEALARRSIPAALLKGPDFADRIYPRPELRPFADIDLLAPADAQEAIARTLQELGYRKVAGEGLKYGSGYGQVGWQRPQQPSGQIEVHWDLVNSPTVRRGVSVGYGDLQFGPAGAAGGPLSRLTPASLLLIAAVHGAAGHQFSPLQILWDIALLARGAAGELDEAWLAEAAGRTGANLSVAAALSVARRVLGDAACGELRVRLGLRSPGWWVAAALSRDVVLGLRAPFGSARRQLLRHKLKKR